MTVTLKEFLDLLPIVDGKDWRIDQDGQIRDRNGRCPICSLLNETHGTRGKLNGWEIWYLIKERPSKWVIDVMCAADNHLSVYGSESSQIKKIRCKLIEILKPKTT